MRLALRGFEVYNDEENGLQTVIALVEADEQRAMRFHNLATKSRPPLAEVDSIKSEDYAGDIMPTWQYAAMNTSSQMNKAIPVLLEIRDVTRIIQDNTKSTPQILEEIKGLRKDVQPGFAMQLKQMQVDIRAIKGTIGHDMRAARGQGRFTAGMCSTTRNRKRRTELEYVIVPSCLPAWME